MKNIKFKALLCLQAAAAIMLCSCGGPSQNSNKPEKTKFSKVVYVDDELDVLTIRSELEDIVGTLGFVKDTEAESDGEIVFGNTNRAITAAAKTALAAELQKSTDNDIGYIIYKEGNNLAIYWDDIGMMNTAVTSFIDVCVKQKRLDIDAGVVACAGYNSEEYELDKYWIALKEVTTPDVVSSLKSLYNGLDGGKIIDFFANLWDGEVGGFYYTAGARDNMGFLPDLESTKQILTSIVENGAISDLDAAFPNEIKAKLVNFAKSTQSATDGYFYHPQWPQDKSQLQTDRYGRDMGHATTIISSFTVDTNGDGIGEVQYPNYCAPNGIKCEKHNGTDTKCSFPAATAYYSDRIDSGVTTSLTSTVSSSVSKLTSSTVTPCASVSSHPDYSSDAAFSAWLEAYNANIKEASGYAHNLSAIRSEITQHGYEQIVLDHLDRVQKEIYDEQVANGEEPTGLWQYNVNYKAVWGFLKYSGYYNAADGKGRAIGREYIPYIVKTFVKVISLPADGNYASNDLYNMWDGIVRLISNAQKYYGDDLVEEIRDIIRENAKVLIDNSLSKIEYLSLGNGTFAYRSDKTSLATIYGTSISPGLVEGNVNSTDIITSMYRAIFEVFGYTPVPLMTKKDGERFISTICTLENVEKQEIKLETMDFENEKLPSTFGYDSKDATFKCEITSDPEDPSNSALYFASPGTGGTNILFSTAGIGSTCYLFESDFYISSETVTNNSSGTADLIQIKLGDATSSGSDNIAYMVVLKKTANGIEIIEKTATDSTGIANSITTVDLDSWFTLRVEYYTVEEDSDDVPHAKIWVNGELVYVSDNIYYGKTSGGNEEPYFGYTKLNIWTLKNPSLYMYMDNCYFAREDKTFDAADDSIYDGRNK